MMGAVSSSLGSATNSYVGAALVVSDATDASSDTAAAVMVVGGAYVHQTAFFGDKVLQ